MTRKQRRNRSTQAPASQPQGWSRELASQAATTAAAVVVIVGGAGAALALPEGMLVTGGHLQLSQPDPSSLVITQGTSRAAADFASFNIGASERVQIRQPDASSALLGRITNGNITEIHGRLDANGRVVLVNPAGILVGPTGVINTAAFTATTLQADPTAFLHNGLLTLKDSGNADSGAAVINQGTIAVADSGYAALLAPNVVNQGQIRAKLGSVQLASGTAASLDVSGDGLLSVALSPGVAGSITHGGTIAASHVRISAGDAAALVSGTVDLGGLIEASNGAQLLGTQPASIAITSAGHINLAGKLDVSSSAPGASGGVITVQAPQIRVKAGAQLDARGDGAGGQILVGGSWQNSQPSLGQALSTTVESGAVLDASATNRGKGGTVVAWSDLGHPTGVTSVAGTLRAEGGRNGGDGGRIETSGRLLRVDGIKVSTQAPMGRNGLWLLDPTNVTIKATGSTGGSLTSALNEPGVTNINTTDIEGAINAGNDVTVLASGTITQSAALAFEVTGSGQAPTLTLDNTSGSKQAITLAAITDRTSATGSGVQLVAKSKGGAITADGAISVKGAITLDNTVDTTTDLSSGITVNGDLRATGDITLRGTSATAEGVRVNTATLISDGGSIGIYGSTLSNSAVGHAVFINTEFEMDIVSAKGNIEIAGFNTSEYLTPKLGDYSGLPDTGYVGTSLGGAFLAGGDIILAGYGYAGGVRVGNAGYYQGAVYADGKLRIVGSTLTSNVATVDANKPATAFADGIGVDFNMKDTTYTPGVGPNLGTYKGIVSKDSATVYGSAEQNNKDEAFGPGVVIGAKITNNTQTMEASSWTITASNGGLEGSQPAFAAYTGSLKSTIGGIVINANSLNSQSQPGGVGINIPIESANGITITSTNKTEGGRVIKLNSAGKLTNKAGAITIIGNSDSVSSVDGITLDGKIDQQANGGNISLISNKGIVQNGTITLANNTAADSTLLFDTTSGNRTAYIIAGGVDAGTSSSKRIDYRALASGAAIKLNSALDMPGSITLDNTYGCSGTGCTPASGYITSDNTWSLATRSGAGIQLSNSLTAQTGLSIRGAVGASSVSAIQTIDAVSILNSDAANPLILSSAGNFSAGQDAISITGITPQHKAAVPTEAGNAIQIAGSGTVTINNKSIGGNTSITANTGRLSLGNTAAIIHDAAVGSGADPTGSIMVNAIGDKADIQTLAGSSITQKSNAGIYLATSKNGNITPPKIINNGSGNVVIGAGATLPVGTATGGQITGLDGNSITSDLGNVYLYSGAPTSDASSTSQTSVTQLGYLSPSLASLSFSNTVFGQAYHVGNGPATSLPDTAINTANGPSTNTSTGSGGTPLIQFRIQPDYKMVLNANLTKVYGSSDPTNGTNSVITPGSLEYALAENFSTAATNPTGVRTNGSTTEIILNVNGVEFYKPLNEFLNTVTGTRPGTTTMAGQQVYDMPSSGAADANYAYTFATSIPGIQLSSGVLTGGSVGSTPVGLSITPKPLTISTNASNFTYDASTAFSNLYTPSGLVSSVDGLATDDALSAVTTTVRSGSTLGQGTAVSSPFSSPANAGSYNSVPSDAVGFGLSNYAITYGGTAFSVAQAPVTVSDLTALNRPYNGTTAAQLVGTPSLVGGLTGAPVTISSGVVSSGTFASPNAGVALGVTPDLSTLVLSNPNYKIVGPTNPLFATISPASLTISGLNAADITYNGSALATISGTASLAGAFDSAPSVSLVGGPVTSGLFASADAATSVTVSPNLGGLSLAGPGAANYVISGTTEPLFATINPKPLTIAGASTSQTFNNQNQVNANPSITGLVGQESLTISGLASGLHAGTYTDTLVYDAGANTKLANYAITVTNGTFKITPALLTAVITPVDKVYNGTTTLASSVSLLDVLPDTSVAGQADLALVAPDAGPQTIINNGISLSGANAGDYAIASYLITDTPSKSIGGSSNGFYGSNNGSGSGVTIAVQRAPVTIAGASTSQTFNNQNQVNANPSITGLVGQESLTISGLASGLHAGSYTDKLVYSGGANTKVANYAITVTNGTFTITPALLRAVITPVDKVYNGTTTLASSVSLSGILPDTSVAGQADLALVAPDAGPQTIINNGISLSGANAGDYAITSYLITDTASKSIGGSNNGLYGSNNGSGSGVTIAVQRAPVTIAGASTSQTFNNQNQVNANPSITGLVGQESLTISGLASGLHAGTYTDKLVYSGGANTDVRNYQISVTNGTFTVTPAPLNATITPADAYYNGSTTLANTVDLSGVLPGTSVFGKADLSLSGPGLGTETIINNGVFLYGANAGDYSLNTFTIANNASKTISGKSNGIIGFNNGNGSGLTISVLLADSFKDDYGIRQLVDSIDPGLVQNQQLAAYFPGASHRPGAAADDNGKDTGRSVRLGPLKPSFRIESDRPSRFDMGLGRLLVDPGVNICLTPAGCGIPSLGLSRTTSYRQLLKPQDTTRPLRSIGTANQVTLPARAMVTDAAPRPVVSPQAVFQSSKANQTGNRLQRLVHWLLSSK